MKKILLIVPVLFFLTACIETIIGGTILGATMVANDKRETGEILADNKAEASIESALRREKLKVDVEIRNNNLLATGLVRDEVEMERVDRIIKKFAGDRRVSNEVLVSKIPMKQKKISNNLLATKVKARMLKSRGVKSMNYNVEAVNSTVYLIGIASSRQEFDKAVDIARTTRGVKRVVSYIEIK